MNTQDSVPSLAALINNESVDYQCCWQNQRKGRKDPKRCRNFIRGRDAMERNNLINDLRALIRSAEGTTTLSPVTPESIPEIHKIFEKVSMWLLCKGRHRSEFGRIVQKWTDELNKVEEAIDLSTTIDIRKELNIQKYEKIFCHGKKNNGTVCSKAISTQNRDYANAVITALGRARDYTPAIEKNILDLAHLLMCQGCHQEQAAEKSKEWLEKIRELLIPADATSAQPSSPQSPSARGQSSTPANNRTGTVDSRTSESVASSVFTEADPIATGTPATSPPSRRRYELRPTDTGSPIRPKRATAAPTVGKTELQSKLTTRVIGNSTLVIQTEPPVPKFKPFPPKSAEAIIARLWERINRPLLPREKQAGYIYGFQRAGDSFIKIGYTCKIGLEARIQEWNTRCRQKVKVVLKEYLPHVAKVESLVHAILHRERRRELLVNGCCNSGKGCSTVHEEWFDVSLDRLLDIVERCKRWIRTWPYENGKLRPVWVEHIQDLYKVWSELLVDNWHAWLDTNILGEGTIIQEAVSSDVKEKTGITVTRTEIKTELAGSEAAGTNDLHRELSAISRGFNESIIEIKAEATEGKPLMEIPQVLQDSSLQIQDPFVEPAVINVTA